MSKTAAEKRCSKCGQTKDVAQFFRQVGRNKDRPHAWCKRCESAYSIEWNRRRRESMRIKKPAVRQNVVEILEVADGGPDDLQEELGEILALWTVGIVEQLETAARSYLKTFMHGEPAEVRFKRLLESRG